MGRCYEFGVVVSSACEHPMVVASDGSACVCSSCGAACKGRFDGCAAVLARPGYSPVVLTVAVPSVAEVAEAPAVSDVPEVQLPVALPPPDHVMESIEALRRDLETRDVALGEAFERLITSYDRLTGAVELLGERLAELEGRDPAPLFPFRRDA